jgi:hypothetical protein
MINIKNTKHLEIIYSKLETMLDHHAIAIEIMKECPEHCLHKFKEKVKADWARIGVI